MQKLLRLIYIFNLFYFYIYRVSQKSTAAKKYIFLNGTPCILVYFRILQNTPYSFYVACTIANFNCFRDIDSQSLTFCILWQAVESKRFELEQKYLHFPILVLHYLYSGTNFRLHRK